MNKTLLAHVSLFTAMVIYAAGFTIIKEVTPQYLSPAGFVALRVLGTTPLLWITGLFFFEKIERKDFGKIALLSLCGVTINQSFFIKGMSLTSPINGAIIMITCPLLVLILGNVILKEKITWQKLCGILIGLGGALLLILSNTISNTKTDSPIGDLLIFINALSWGTFLVLVTPLMKKYHPVTILKWSFLMSIPILVPLGIPNLLEVNFNSFDGKTIFDILFVIVGVTFIAYLMNIFALKALSPTVVSAYIYTQPIMAAVIALVLGKDILGWQQIVSAILIFTGVLLASQKKTVIDNSTVT